MISPNGENAPPAFADTTIFINPGTMNALLPRPATVTTVPKISAVVKLSAIGDKKNAITPVMTKIFL